MKSIKFDYQYIFKCTENQLAIALCLVKLNELNVIFLISQIKQKCQLRGDLLNNSN